MRLILSALTALALFAGMGGCAVTGSLLGESPEHQIVNGANSVNTAAVSASVLLKRGIITKSQAQGYSGLLHAAAGHLDDANTRLVACRQKTGSNPKSNPDPCKPTVGSDISLGLSVVADVKRTIDAKGE